MSMFDVLLEVLGAVGDIVAFDKTLSVKKYFSGNSIVIFIIIIAERTL